MKLVDIDAINKAIEAQDLGLAEHILTSLAQGGDVEAVVHLANDAFLLKRPALQMKWQEELQILVEHEHPFALFVEFNKALATSPAANIRELLDRAVRAGSADAMVELARYYRLGAMGYEKSEFKYQEMIDKAINLGSVDAIAERTLDLIAHDRPIPQGYSARLVASYDEARSSRVRDVVDLLQAKVPGSN